MQLKDQTSIRKVKPKLFLQKYILFDTLEYKKRKKQAYLKESALKEDQKKRG